MAVTPTDVLRSYKKLLKRRDKKMLLKKLEAIKKINPDGAKFEAAVYSILQSYKIRVEFEDDSRLGGPDFKCTVSDKPFVVEATSIETISAEKITGLSNDQRNIKAGFFIPYSKVWSKLKNKVNQVSQKKYNYARIIAIGSFHSESNMFFTQVVPDEYLSVFFLKEKNRRLIPNNKFKSISAFLLIGFGYDCYTIQGFLNPEPEFPFPFELFSDIPFRRITKFGIEGGNGEGEWVNEKKCSETRYPLKLV